MKDIADTICALSTPPGRSGIAVVRVSGLLALEIVRRIFYPRTAFEPLPYRYAMIGRLVDPRDGSEIDEAIATCFPAPHSYTGEDMGEFSIHGSPVLISSLLDCLCASGARIAEPGEFTMRAFLHGRIDLTQAEAIRDIIDARTLYQAQVAARQRSGLLAREIRPIKELLTSVIVDLESTVEFADQDLPVASRDSIARQLEDIRGNLRGWIDSFRRGRVIRGGFSMAVVGRPNVGKSTLFNALTKAGVYAADQLFATLDTTSRKLWLPEAGSIVISDTVGFIRDLPHSLVAAFQATLEATAEADLLLHVVDSASPVREEQIVEVNKVLTEIGADQVPQILVWNKADLTGLPPAVERGDYDRIRRVRVSARTGEGLDLLRQALVEFAQEKSRGSVKPESAESEIPAADTAIDASPPT